MLAGTGTTLTDWATRSHRRSDPGVLAAESMARRLHFARRPSKLGRDWSGIA